MIDRLSTAAFTDERLVMTREFAAPRERVFAAWTDAALWARWFGPHGCTIAPCTLDARPGGELHFRLIDGGGTSVECWIGGVVREIAPPERFVFTFSFHDEHGNVVPASTYGHSPEFPLEMLVIVTFADRGDRTLVTVDQTVSVDVPERADMVEGWGQGFERLDQVLATA